MTKVMDHGGKRVKTGNGAEREAPTGKGRFDLIPGIAIERLAQHYEAGARKYSKERLFTYDEALEWLASLIAPTAVSLSLFLPGSDAPSVGGISVPSELFILTMTMNLGSSEDSFAVAATTASGSLEKAWSYLKERSLISGNRPRLSDDLDRIRVFISGDRNWEKGLPLARFIDSAYRHLTQFTKDDRTEDHLSSILWNIAGYMWTEEEIKRGRLPKELDDVPWPHSVFTKEDEAEVKAIVEERAAGSGLKKAKPRRKRP